MQFNMRRYSLYLVLYFIMVFVIVSCASNKDEKSEEGLGKIYKFPCSNAINSLDPAHIENMSEESIISEIYNTLVAVDDSFEIIPELAESWDYDEDQAIYTFYLQREVRFHNGEELTANDVIASISRLVDIDEQASNFQWVMWIKGTSSYRKREADSIEGLRAIDDHTVEIELHQTHVPFLSMLTTSFFSILSSKEISMSKSGGTFKPVGTGPFIHRSTHDDNLVVLEANRNYFQGSPYLDGIEYHVITDPEEMVSLYKEGNLNHVWVFPELAEKILKDEDITGQVYNYPVNALYYYAFNLDKVNKFGGSREDKVLLRQAINFAVDREEICSNVYKSRCIPVMTVVPSNMCGYFHPLADRLGFTRDVSKVEELLSEAGYKDGESIGMVSLFTTFESPNYAIASIVKNNLNEFGMNVEIVAKDKENYLKAIYDGDPALFSYEWYMRYPDLDDIFSQFHSENAKGGINLANMTRDYIDRSIDRGRRTHDHQERTDIYRDLEQQILLDSPWVFMFQLRNAVLIRPEVVGLSDQLGQFDYRDSLSHVRMELVDLVVKEE